MLSTAHHDDVLLIRLDDRKMIEHRRSSTPPLDYTGQLLEIMRGVAGVKVFELVLDASALSRPRRRWPSASSTRSRQQKC